MLLTCLLSGPLGASNPLAHRQGHSEHSVTCPLPWLCKVVQHSYLGWYYGSDRLISLWFYQKFFQMVTDSPTGSFPFLILTCIFIACLMGLKWHCVLMYIDLITRNLGNFFIYLSAFLVSLSMNCSLIFAHFLMSLCLFSRVAHNFLGSCNWLSEWHLGLYI